MRLISRWIFLVVNLYAHYLSNIYSKWEGWPIVLIGAPYLGTAWRWNGLHGASWGSCWGQKERLKQTSYYLFGVQALSITAGPQSLPSCKAATTSSSFSTESHSYSPMIDVSREAPQGGAKWSYSIFPIMSRRRSLTLMLFAMLLPAQLLL